MGSFDLFTERVLRDKFDENSSRAFSKEATSLDLIKLHQKHSQSGRDKVNFATASLVLGSPFMILGLGISLFDEIGAIKAGRKLSEIQDTRRRLSSIQKGENELDLQMRRGNRETRLSSVVSFSDLDQKIARRIRLSDKKKDQAIFADKRRNVRPFLTIGKNWLETSRLLKRKQFLQDQIERLNNGKNCNLVSSLFAKLELLNKALKMLGC